MKKLKILFAIWAAICAAIATFEGRNEIQIDPPAPIAWSLRFGWWFTLPGQILKVMGETFWKELTKPTGGDTGYPTSSG